MPNRRRIFLLRHGVETPSPSVSHHLKASTLRTDELFVHRGRRVFSVTNYSDFSVRPNSLARLKRVNLTPEMRKLCLWAMVFLRKEKHPNATSLRKSYARVFREGKIKNMPNIATIGRVFSTLRNAGVLEEKKY